MKYQRKRRIKSDKEILEKNISKMDLNFCKNITVSRKKNSKNEIVPFISFNCPSNHLIEILPQNIHKSRSIKCEDCKKEIIEKNRKFKTDTIEDVRYEIEKTFPFKYQITKFDIIEGKKKVSGFCNDCKTEFEKKNLYHIISRKQIVCKKDCRAEKRRKDEKDEKTKFYQAKININPNRNYEIFVDDIEYVDEKVWVYTKCTKHTKIKKDDNFFIGSTMNKHVPCKGCIEENKIYLNKRKLSEEKVIETAKLKINNTHFIPFKALFVKTKSGSSYWNVFFRCLLHPNNSPRKKISGQITNETIPCNLCKPKKLINNAENFLKKCTEIHPQYKYNENAIRKAFEIDIKKIPVICNVFGHGTFFTNYEQHIKNKKGFCDKCITSAGQEQVRTILLKNNIIFEHNTSFKNLGIKYPEFYSGEKDSKSELKNLRPDFYLPESNFLIEYDGIYHFDIKKHRREANFYNLIKNDSLKDRYASKNNINILRISCLSDKNKDYDYTAQLILESIDLINNGKFIYNIQDIKLRENLKYEYDKN